jgi:multiple sugar transport system substrate-binding protein
MTQKSHEALTTMMMDARKGRLNRRAFLERALALGVSSSAALTLFSACGGTSGGDSGPITLTLWDYFSTAGKGYLGLIDDYTKKVKPSVKIQRTSIPFADLKQKLTQGAASGQLPDIVLIDNPDHSAFADLGVLADLTNRVKAWGKASQYITGPWQSTVWKDKNYGVPNNSNCLALFYNKDMFQQAGLTPPTNWDELKNAAQKLTKNGVYGFSMSLVKSEEGTFQFLPFLWEAGADLDTIDSPEAISALQLLADFAKNGQLSHESLNWAQQDAITQFIGEKAAMCVNGPWNLPPVQEGAKFKWGVVPLPKGKQSASILGGENWAIPSSSKHVQEAWDFIQWTQLPDNLKSYIVTDVRLPSTKDLTKDEAFQKDPNLAVFANSLETARPRAYGPKYPQISNAVQEAFQAAISGQKSASDALKQAATIIKPLMASS